MYRLLDLAGPEQAGEVRSPSSQTYVPPDWPSAAGPRSPTTFVVATPLLTRDGRLIASISAAVDASEADRLDDVGEELKKAAATLGRKYGLQAS